MLTVSKEDVEKIELDVAPQVIDGRTLVPARFIAEALGAKVEWDESTQTVNIYSDKIPEINPSTLILSLIHISCFLPLTVKKQPVSRKEFT